MFVNRMTVQVTVKCGECPRTAMTVAQLCPSPVPGEMALRSDTMAPPADWKQIQVDSRNSELFCPICSRDAL